MPFIRLLAGSEAASDAGLAPHKISTAVTLPVCDAAAGLDALHDAISSDLGAEVALEWRPDRTELRAGGVRLTLVGGAVRCEWDSSADDDTASRAVLSAVTQWCRRAPPPPAG